MGFGEEESLDALRMFRNDQDAAVSLYFVLSVAIRPKVCVSCDTMKKVFIHFIHLMSLHILK